ncbi:MAG TPA: FeoB small GTPase domain-containing protein, partial [Acidobacteriota bacterium]|nr:FeoB small GTPase domain-containing protein [Acidobacteriota bacterium]
MSSSRPDPALSSPPELTALRTVALAGNPNCGKTTVFNALTGLRQKVGNYPGVTVEKKEGRLRVEQVDLTLVDIPGTYSLSARSLDEQVARDVLLGLMEGSTRPDLIVSIVDASNLERNLYLTTQLMELGRPVIVALNMMDVAAQNGLDLDAQLLAQHLGVPVIPLVASRNIGFEQLRQSLIGTLPPLPKRQWALPREVEHEIQKLAGLLVQQGLQSEATEG